MWEAKGMKRLKSHFIPSSFQLSSLDRLWFQETIEGLSCLDQIGPFLYFCWCWNGLEGTDASGSKQLFGKAAEILYTSLRVGVRLLD